MAKLSIPAPETPTVAVTDGSAFPVRRIFCVGKNYIDHVKEMGEDPKEIPPVFFSKPADAVSPGGDLPFPPMTENLHFEGEVVVALKSGGSDIAEGDANQHIFGYATGCDLTRRDLQFAAKDKGAPWDTAKALDRGAVIGAITPVGATGILEVGTITLTVNGTVRQQDDLSSMIYSVPEVIARLSQFFELKAGDLIYTGTPEGVGQLFAGDTCRVEFDGLEPVEFTLAPRAQA